MAPPAKRETAKVLFATLVGTMDNNALIPVITFYALALGADPLMAGLIVGAYSFVHIPANIAFGRLADRIGRKRPLVYGLLWDAVSLALYAAATSPLGLLLVRLSHGLGGGFVGPASMALVSDRADPSRKGRAFAVYGISIAIAVILGFAVAGIASARNALRPMFFGLSFALWVGAVVASRIRESRAAGRTPALDLSAFLRFLRYRGAVGGYAAIFALYFLLGALIVLAPLEFKDPPIGLIPSTFAIALLVFAVVSVAVHYPSGLLSDRYGPQVPCAAGLICVSAAMALLPSATSFGILVALMAVFGLGHGLIFPSSSALATRHARRDSLGLATGVYYALLVAGVAIGAPIAGAIASSPWTPAGGFVASAAVSVIALLLLVPAALAAREGLRSPE